MPHDVMTRGNYRVRDLSLRVMPCSDESAAYVSIAPQHKLPPAGVYTFPEHLRYFNAWDILFKLPQKSLKCSGFVKKSARGDVTGERTVALENSRANIKICSADTRYGFHRPVYALRSLLEPKPRVSVLL